MRVLTIQDPGILLDLLGPLPLGCSTTEDPALGFDVAVVFGTQREQLQQSFSLAVSHLAPTSCIWCAWPKKASKLPTDVNFGVVQRMGLDVGLVDIKNCAVDEVWSGLKFVVRKTNRENWNPGAVS